MDVFNRIAEEQFVQRMMSHVHQCFPDESAKLSEEKLKDKIQCQIAKARSYGIAANNDICDFISICFVLGDDFDTDPTLDSISAVLNNPGLQSGSAKMMHLDDAVMKYLEQT